MILVGPFQLEIFHDSLVPGICLKALGLFAGSTAGLEEQLPHVERYETVLPRELPVPRGKRDLSSPPVSHSSAPSLLSRESGLQSAGILSHHQVDPLTNNLARPPQPCTKRMTCHPLPCLASTPEMLKQLIRSAFLGRFGSN